MNNPKKLWWIFQQQFYGRGKYNRSDTLKNKGAKRIFSDAKNHFWFPKEL